MVLSIDSDLSHHGTSRIIALLLGRLRMSVDDAIQAFMFITAKAFSTPTLFGTQESRGNALEEALKDIVRLKTGNGESRMTFDSKCKV